MLTLGHGQPVDHGVDVVPLLLVEDDLFGEVPHVAVDPHTDITALAQVFEDRQVLALLVAHQG